MIHTIYLVYICGISDDKNVVMSYKNKEKAMSHVEEGNRTKMFCGRYEMDEIDFDDSE